MGLSPFPPYPLASPRRGEAAALCAAEGGILHSHVVLSYPLPGRGYGWGSRRSLRIPRRPPAGGKLPSPARPKGVHATLTLFSFLPPPLGGGRRWGSWRFLGVPWRPPAGGKLPRFARRKGVLSTLILLSFLPPPLGGGRGVGLSAFSPYPSASPRRGEAAALCEAEGGNFSAGGPHCRLGARTAGEVVFEKFEKTAKNILQIKNHML